MLHGMPAGETPRMTLKAYRLGPARAPARCADCSALTALPCVRDAGKTAGSAPAVRRCDGTQARGLGRAAGGPWRGRRAGGGAAGRDRLVGKEVEGHAGQLEAVQAVRRRDRRDRVGHERRPAPIARD